MIDEDWLFWLTIGDWHLEPQGGERGEAAANVCDVLGVVVDVRVDNRIVGLVIGDWHLVP